MIAANSKSSVAYLFSFMYKCGSAVALLYSMPSSCLRLRLKERGKDDGTCRMALQVLLRTGTCHFHISLAKASQMEAGTITLRKYISQEI